MRKVEVSLATLGVLGLFVALVKYGGGPQSWDELYYMHVSMNPSKIAEIFNRYFHIYFQRPFLLLMPDFMDGAKVCWSFMFSITTLFVYVSARIVGKRRYCGILAVCFFLSSVNWGYYAGVTYADITVMMLTAIGLFLYVAFHQGRSRLKYAFPILFGAILLFAVKSKETGLCLMILLPGFAERSAGRFSCAKTSKAFLGIAAGVIIAGVIFSILDYIHLGDPFFWCRFSNLDTLLEFNRGAIQRGYESWLAKVARGVPVLAFSLYVAVGLTSLRTRYHYHEKIAWLYPVLILLFLTLTQIQGKVGIIERYYFPVLPFVCLWAAQFFDCRRLVVANQNNVAGANGRPGPCPAPVGGKSAEREGIDPTQACTEQPDTQGTTGLCAGATGRYGAFRAEYLNPQFLSYLLVIALAVVIVITVESKVYEWAEPFGWDERWDTPDYLYFSVVLPAAVMFFWAGVVILKRGTRKWVFVAALSLFCAFYHPLVNTVCLLRDGALVRVAKGRFYPLRAFREHLDLDGNVRIYVSRNMLSRKRNWQRTLMSRKRRWRMLGRDSVSCMWMFNLYFRRNMRTDQFVSAGELSLILTTPCDYAIVGAREWQATEKTKLGKRLLQSYEVVREKLNRVVLLRLREKKTHNLVPATRRSHQLG